MFFWHIGATTAFIRYAFRDPNMDLRFLALGAIASDIIDLPIGIAMWDTVGSVRLAAHSLPFGALVMAAVLILTRRGPRRKRWMLFAVGVLLHLLLDAMWRQPETLWWPFLGWDFTPSGFATYAAYASDVVTNPIMWGGEVAGLAYLVWLAVRARLSDPERRRVLRSTGVISVRID